MRRKVSAIELHSLDIIDRCLKALALFNGDNAVFADLHECLSHPLANHHVVIG